jgi:CheY-like chemotaxis protein/HPt (histidine-containing phosphotransfer) domain-containing protein
MPTGPKSVPDQRGFSLEAALETVLGPLQTLAARRGCLLAADREEDLPERFSGDAAPFCQALAILLERAVTLARPGGEVALYICEAALDDAGMTLCISISGQGSGMDDAGWAVLCGEPPAAGTDAGEVRQLLTARRLIGEMGGEIWVDSVPGMGSNLQFTVRYPLCGDQPAPVGAIPPLRILLVDDVEINQELARVVMEKEGHCVMVAANGAEAVTACRNRQFDLIFMDIQMPVMDGFQAARAIRDLERSQGTPHTPIIAMTAYSSTQDQQECRDAGMDSYIAKPTRPDAIIAAIRRHAAPRRAEAGGPPSLPIADTPTDGGDAGPVFDRADLLERLGGKAEVIPRFVSLFLVTAEAAITAARNALDTGDATELHKQAHTLKGAAANIGACRIKAVAGMLDDRTRAGDTSTAPSLLAELEAELALFRRTVAPV